MPEKPRNKSAVSGGRGAFYRLMRDWHGYLSAFSFLALLFFAVTGILLNHPGLLSGKASPLVEKTVTLTPDDVTRIKAASEPGRTLVEIVGETVKLNGAYQNGEASGPDVFVRMQSVRGSSNLRGNLETGRTEVTVETLSVTEVLNGLHRGEQAGKAWRLWIDVIAAVLIVLSIFGYILFFSLRFRMKTALVLTGASAVVMIAVFVAMAP